jgi:cyclase
MALPRIIPVLLLSNNGLVKTIKFKNPKYLGDPINAVKIFNSKLADEIVILDITASEQNIEPNYSLIEKVGKEAFMPFSYGGGIKQVSQALKILKLGAEKVILNNVLFENESIITDISNSVGKQSVVASIDIKKNFFGKYVVVKHRGKKNTKLDPIIFAKRMEELGSGEIFINNVDLDSEMKGYDLEYMKTIIDSVDVPVVICGGAKDKEDIIRAFNETKVSGCAAGSMFVYNGDLRGFLISYLNVDEILNKIKRNIYE